eukprot:2199522-Prymnesium_polylepis.1
MHVKQISVGAIYGAAELYMLTDKCASTMRDCERRADELGRACEVGGADSYGGVRLSRPHCRQLTGAPFARCFAGRKATPTRGSLSSARCRRSAPSRARTPT